MLARKEKSGGGAAIRTIVRRVGHGRDHHIGEAFRRERIGFRRCRGFSVLARD
jgi:hypothetical protein